MHLSTIHVNNFRLLRDVTLTLENGVTVIVGRNNSGKTSLTELFRRLLSDVSPTFRLEDFSCATHSQFFEAYRLLRLERPLDEIRAVIPAIDVRLTISYAADTTSLGPLSDFIVDLDPECTDAVLLIRYELKDGAIATLFAGCDIDPDNATQQEHEAFFQTIRDRLPRLFGVALHAVDPNDATNRKALDWKALHTLIRSGFVNAQRWLDDTTHKDNDALGKLLESIFTTAKSENANDSDQKIAAQLETAVEDLRLDLDTTFNEHLTTLLPALNLFGYPGLTDPKLRTETTLDVQRVLVNHTKVRYAGADSISLPESYNGLGPRNLILIFLHLVDFFKSFQAAAEATGIHLVFIEEPEAHLHPQVAEVFIRKLSEIATTLAKTYNNDVPWPVQFIVSTHSSHMANEARFETIRYFLAPPEADGYHKRQTRVKDLRRGMGDASQEDRDFLHQYMTLTRCDLFFADKAALIEGCAERILLPKMIAKVDAEPQGQNLANQYVTVVEICGAYAHRFFKLIDFLELRTLIITDIDSAKKNGKNRLKKCLVAQGTHTTNACIKNWFDDKHISPDLLISKTDADKCHGVLRLAYQIPETPDAPCGRSFEDAFMLANQDIFDISDTPATDKAQLAWDKAADVNKAEFALQHALETDQWTVPRYIAEGLRWLAGHPTTTHPPTTAGAPSEGEASND